MSETSNPKCNVPLDLADDYGDNPCTFHCQLEPNHPGRHREIGKVAEQEFRIEWVLPGEGWRNY